MATTSLLLGLVGLNLSAGHSFAQVFVVADGDLVLNFSQSGGSSDLEVDLGPVSTYLNQTPGTTVDLASKYSVTLLSSPTFSSLNSLSFSVLATQRGTGSSYPVNTSWLTLARTDPATQTAAPFGYTASKSSSIQNAISGIYGIGSGTGANNYAASASYPPSTSTALILPTTGVAGANSYTTKYNATSGLASLVNSPGVENTTPSNFTTTPGAFIVSDLYQYLPNTKNTAATYLGDFTFYNNGDVTFTAVPEPEEYAAIFAVGLLGLGLYRKGHRAVR